MYCFGCEYELTGLTKGNCPECGRAFDPAVPATLASEQHLVRRGRRARRLEIALICVGAVPMMANLFGFAALLVARTTLGRWPYRGGRDDPSDVPGVGLLGAAALLLVIMTLPALFVGVLMAFALVTHEAWQRLMRGGLIAIALWSAGFLLARLDPAEVWMWLWD